MKKLHFHLIGGTIISYHAVEDGSAEAIIEWAQQEPGKGKETCTFTTDKNETEQGGTHIFRRSNLAYLDVRDIG